MTRQKKYRSRYSRARSERTRGYTVIELVAVITILGVLGAMAGPRFWNNNVFRERGYADELASALRYAQKIAVASDCAVQVTITSNSYSAFQRAASGNTCSASGSWSTPVQLPDGNSLAGSAPSGVTVAPAATFIFSGDGRPTAISNTSLTIGARTLTVYGGTGFVDVQ